MVRIRILSVQKAMMNIAITAHGQPANTGNRAKPMQRSFDGEQDTTATSSEQAFISPFLTWQFSTSQFSTWLTAGLIAWLLVGCSEPQDLDHYIAASHQQAKATAPSAPLALLVVNEEPQAAPMPAYQALTRRSPFLWPHETRLPAHSAGEEAHKALISQVDLSPQLPLDCQLAPLAEPANLVLRATFSDHAGRGRTALIQVNAGEVYRVRLGQRLRINSERAGAQKREADAALSEDLGQVTAITAQSLTLSSNHALSSSNTNQDCPRLLHTVLNLY